MLKDLLFRYKTSSTYNPSRLVRPIWRMMALDRKARQGNITRRESLDGTLNWLLTAQDATRDGGVSSGYSLIDGWLKSFPETTGYIMQTLVRHYSLFGGDSLLQRAERMAHWEVEVQWENGGIPGSWLAPAERPVAFNTGQVLLGWAALLRVRDSPRIRDAAARASFWLLECLAPEGYFEHGLSEASRHGKLSHNSMVSWGLMEVAAVLDDEKLAAAATRSAEYYASTINKYNWPVMAGIDAPEADFPLTHALGYTIQGILETGVRSENHDLIEVAVRTMEASLKLIDKRGLLPGRISKNWEGGTTWCCLTGSSQFACAMLRLELEGISREFSPAAERLVDFVVRTQIAGADDAEGTVYGVRGSYPFHLGGYCRATYPNWAAKFHIDTLHMLHSLGRLDNRKTGNVA